MFSSINIIEVNDKKMLGKMTSFLSLQMNKV